MAFKTKTDILVDGLYMIREDLLNTMEDLRGLGKALGVNPDYFETAGRFADSLVGGGSQENQGLYNNASSEWKNLLRKFSMTTQDFDKYYTGYFGHKPLQDLLETVFKLSLFYDSQVYKRYSELVETVESFKEILPKVYLYNGNRHVYVVYGIEGKFFRFTKRPGFLGYRVDGLDIYLVYENGQADIVCENGTYSEDCVCAEVVVDKEYSRVSVDNKYFRAHTLFLALQYGVDILKYTLGRHSLLTVDHINNVPYDNRVSNLRVITRSDNTLLQTHPERDVFDFLNLS